MNHRDTFDQMWLHTCKHIVAAYLHWRAIYGAEAAYKRFVGHTTAFLEDQPQIDTLSPDQMLARQIVIAGLQYITCQIVMGAFDDDTNA